MKAEFEVRQGQLAAARKKLGQAIGMCPKDKIFRGYIELEKKLVRVPAVPHAVREAHRLQPGQLQHLGALGRAGARARRRGPRARHLRRGHRPARARHARGAVEVVH